MRGGDSIGVPGTLAWRTAAGGPLRDRLSARSPSWRAIAAMGTVLEETPGHEKDHRSELAGDAAHGAVAPRAAESATRGRALRLRQPHRGCADRRPVRRGADRHP